MEHGDQVKCLAGDVDQNKRDGQIGIVSGFATFSGYHPKEVLVKFGDGATAWFWYRDLEAVA